jgi:hypothetical protein
MAAGLLEEALGAVFSKDKIIMPGNYATCASRGIHCCLMSEYVHVLLLLLLSASHMLEPTLLGRICCNSVLVLPR